jgi:hypothetical protein
LSLKLLYPALQNLSQEWTMPVKDWQAALIQLAIRFEGSLPFVYPAVYTKGYTPLDPAPK